MIELEARQALQTFIERGLKDYDQLRNYDLGPGDRSNVSHLSKYIQRRILTEKDVIDTCLRIYPKEKIFKYIQEVYWRTYWKGWLEMRPQVWDQYLIDLTQLEKEWEGHPKLKTALDARTGIECFDSWVRELEETGYLHNHARMWFASIWIFTLKLPWQLGAAYFFRHLLDSDAASNTLSWRWVAGLQTKGKFYLATADNIEKFTRSRFPRTKNLEIHARPIEEAISLEASEIPKLPSEPKPAHGHKALWIHPDDLSVGSLYKNSLEQISLVFSFQTESILQKYRFSKQYCEFTTKAIQESLSSFACPYAELSSETELLRQLEAHQIQTVTYVKPFVGPWREIENLILNSSAHPKEALRRSWDTELFPLAKKGFFPFMEALAIKPHST
jgi:deoxyribodipyrimidine photo-lyase